MTSTADPASAQNLGNPLPTLREHNERGGRTLRELQRTYPLGLGWSEPALALGSSDLPGLRIHWAGLTAANHRGAEITGSAGGTTPAQLPRAYFELVERASIVDALAAPRESYIVRDACGTALAHAPRDQVFPTSPPRARWTYSRSNGVAAGRTFSDACMAAHAELVERGRLLLAWFGQTQPTRLTAAPPHPALSRDYDFQLYEFPNLASQAGVPSLDVVGVFALPRHSTAPLVFGTAAAATRSAALSAAWRECIQRLAFLWGEPIPEHAPAFAATPDYHQDFYLWPRQRSRFEAWLRGDHAATARSATAPASVPLGFVDLTPNQLTGRLHVVKAVGGRELPLVFGLGHPCFPDAPEALGIHPIA